MLVVGFIKRSWSQFSKASWIGFELIIIIKKKNLMLFKKNKKQKKSFGQSSHGHRFNGDYEVYIWGQVLNCGLKFEAEPQCRLSCVGLASSSFVCKRPIRLLSNLCKMAQPKCWRCACKLDQLNWSIEPKPAGPN